MSGVWGVTGDAIKGVARAIMSSIRSEADNARAEHVFVGRYVNDTFSDAATAATAITETPLIQVVATSSVVKSISVSAPIAVALNAANFATFNIYKRTGAAARVLIGTFNTSATNMVAFVPVPLTLTAANVNLLAADVLTYEVVKSGTGVALNAATSNCDVTIYIQESD